MLSVALTLALEGGDKAPALAAAGGVLGAALVLAARRRLPNGCSSPRGCKAPIRSARCSSSP